MAWVWASYKAKDLDSHVEIIERLGHNELNCENRGTEIFGQKKFVKSHKINGKKIAKQFFYREITIIPEIFVT